MKQEYLRTVEHGNRVLEVLNPTTGETHAIISILSYDFDLQKNLIVTGIDMTDFFKKSQFSSSSITQLDQKIISHLQEERPCVHTFSSNFPFTIYSKD